ncbi:MAG TPA: hypothetical protein VKU00_11435 [Chthonomonadaceae bacterium]|nr:hypothetical protein [Chthonomonadaceae bacterium]
MRLRDHIPIEVLIDYVDNQLDTEAVARVRDHIASGCKLCAEELANWVRIMSRLKSEQTYPTPQPVLHRAFALFDTMERKPSFLEKVMASLVFDSRQQLLTAGARDLQQASFKLLFEAQDTRIDLLCERESDHWALAGQVLAPHASELGWKIGLTGEETQRQISADAFGEFQILGLKAGSYDLTLQDGSREIVLPTLVL